MRGRHTRDVEVLINEAESLFVLSCSLSIKILMNTKTPWGGDLCRLNLAMRSLWLCIDVNDLNFLFSYFLLEDILRLLDIDRKCLCFALIVLL